MSLFYNPQTKRPHQWVIILFILIPIILICFLVAATKGLVNQNKLKNENTEEVDIFSIK